MSALSSDTTPYDPSSTVDYTHYTAAQAPKSDGIYELKMPTTGELLAARFIERKHLLAPWLRQHENCMVYASTGVGKSLFALSAALAITGGASFLGWKPDSSPTGAGWRVLYVDGEMHIGDIQERVRALRAGMSDLDAKAVDKNLIFLARQHQEPGTQFPSITERAGQAFVLDQVAEKNVDLVVLDNFTTLGDVEDENAASSFNAIQTFLLNLKVRQVATILVHHTGKSEDTFRGSSKLAATFETIIQLERPEVAVRDHLAGRTRTLRAEVDGARFRVRWDKVRSGKTSPKGVIAVLENNPVQFGDASVAKWDFVQTTEMEHLDELLEKLSAGDFAYQKEIGDYFNVSATTAKKYLDRGQRLGLWNGNTERQWLAYGKKRRTEGKSQAPVRAEAAPLTKEEAEKFAL